MHIAEILKQRKTCLSFEFFPPKTPKGSETLYQTIRELAPLKPAYVSVTYGAGGSTRDLTHDIVVKIQSETDLTVVSHLTCVGSDKEEIHGILERYRQSGIKNILALRGDPPKGQAQWTQTEGGFEYAAQLVAFIKQHFPEMGVGVAGFPEGHPQTPNRLLEIDYMKAKADAGADYICTQLFFDNRDFYDFRERCELAGITIPILAGIMPITSRSNLARMAELAAGTRYPAPLLKALDRVEDDQVEKVGINWASDQVRDLIENQARGIHFYTLNKSKATREIYESLGGAGALSLAR